MAWSDAPPGAARTDPFRRLGPVPARPGASGTRRWVACSGRLEIAAQPAAPVDAEGHPTRTTAAVSTACTEGIAASEVCSFLSVRYYVVHGVQTLLAAADSKHGLVVCGDCDAVTGCSPPPPLPRRARGEAPGGTRHRLYRPSGSRDII